MVLSHRCRRSSRKRSGLARARFRMTPVRQLQAPRASALDVQFGRSRVVVRSLSVEASREAQAA